MRLSSFSIIVATLLLWLGGAAPSLTLAKHRGNAAPIVQPLPIIGLYPPEKYPDSPLNYRSTPSPSPEPYPPPGSIPCNDFDTWKHTWNPRRLAIIDPCLEAVGEVKRLQRSLDGDAIMQVAVDSGFEYLLSQGNRRYRDGRLVVEIVCAYRPVDRRARKVCAGYENPLSIPKVGDRIRVFGAWVTDTGHGAFEWNEIHPVYSMQILKGEDKTFSPCLSFNRKNPWRKAATDCRNNR